MTVLAVPVAQHEGFAVGTLNDSRILLVSTYLYLFKCAVTLAGVVGTLMNRAGDAVICLFFHNFSIASRNHFSVARLQCPCKNGQPIICALSARTENCCRLAVSRIPCGEYFHIPLLLCCEICAEYMADYANCTYFAAKIDDYFILTFLDIRSTL